jgi:MFS transporter, DHA2 family, multidrug resistance protein
VTALSVSVLPVMFTDEERPAALAILFGSAMVAYPIGPLLGGWLLTNYSWGWGFLINVPIVILALVAVSRFLPESRSPKRSQIDVPGVIISSAGLAILTYGVIQAGQKSWGDARAVAGMVVGAIVLAGFWLWERRVARRGGEPLVDLTLFRSRGFSASTALATLSTLVMFGLLYAMPQYFGEVVGTTPMGAGVRLLPTIGGLLVGLLLATGLERPAGGRARMGAKAAAALGFAVMAVGGVHRCPDHCRHRRSVHRRLVLRRRVRAWLRAADRDERGAGALSPERSGVGSALIMALRFVGATIGVAALGTLLNNAYGSRIDAARLPDSIPPVVHQGAAEGVAVAEKLGLPGLLHLVRSAFVHGIDVTLIACGLIGVVAVVLALAFLPSGQAATPQLVEAREPGAGRVRAPAGGLNAGGQGMDWGC